MADGTVGMDVRSLIAVWPVDAPRGAVARFCREHQISRSWFYELRARARDDAAGVLPRSRRPVSSPAAVSAFVEDLAVRGRKELIEQGWDAGPISVACWLHRQGVDPPSRATLARIFVRRGLVVPQPQKRPRTAWRRFQFGLVHECWQLDASEWQLADATTVAIFQLIDDRSRLSLASLAASGETAPAALAVVQTAIDRHRPPLLLLSDNGSALNPTRRGRRGLLETSLRTRGVRPITSTPYHPQTCGKNERIHSTLKRWLKARPAPTTLDGLQQLLDTFDDAYNRHRPHQALHGATPQSVHDSAPHAPLPTPPDPDPAPPETLPNITHRPAFTTAKISPNGTAGIAGKVIQLGRSYTHTHVHARHDSNIISVYDPHGTLIRTVTINPHQRYYGLNSPHSTETSQATGMS